MNEIELIDGEMYLVGDNDSTRLCEWDEYWNIFRLDGDDTWTTKRTEPTIIPLALAIRAPELQERLDAEGKDFEQFINDVQLATGLHETWEYRDQVIRDVKKLQAENERLTERIKHWQCYKNGYYDAVEKNERLTAALEAVVSDMKSWADEDGNPLDYDSVDDEVSELYRVCRDALQGGE